MPELHIMILAAGAATRMRGRDKLLEPIHGTPLLRHLTLQALGCGKPVWICLPKDGARHAVIADLAVQPVTVPSAQPSMAQSLRAGLAMIPTQAAVMVLLADLPELTTADLAQVIAAWQNTPERPHRGASALGIPGHPVILPADLRPRLMALHGDQGAKAALGPDVVLVPLPGEHATTDLDTPEAWAAWRAKQVPASL